MVPGYSFGIDKLNFETKESFDKNNKFLSILGFLTYGYKFRTNFIIEQDTRVSIDRKGILYLLSSVENECNEVLNLLNKVGEADKETLKECIEITKYVRSNVRQVNFIRRDLDTNILEEFLTYNDIKNFVVGINSKEDKIIKAAKELMEFMESPNPDSIFQTLSGIIVTKKDFELYNFRYSVDSGSTLETPTIDFYRNILFNVSDVIELKKKRVEEIIDKKMKGAINGNAC